MTMAHSADPKDHSHSTVECGVTVTNKHGLHLRAAGRLVDVANQFGSNVRIRKGQKEVDGKSIMEVMTLAATTGTPLVLCATGPDAEDAVTSLAHLVQNKFGEE